MDLVPFGEPIPTWPGERWGGRTWYLRSFTCSPMTVAVPQVQRADARRLLGLLGQRRRRARPVLADAGDALEGIDLALLQAPVMRNAIGGRREQTVIVTSGHRQLPDLVDTERVEILRGNLTDESAEAA